MKYYVIINGESSLNITGLAIQSLPPISKPLMRSKQETIDGRDGDVITKLGYAAYDKTLKIGLWGNYDLDEIITFFNQEGEIVFSSEPDKYYRFTILNRDDYVNQLEIFKTATIILHCQPYKYLLNEEPKEMENEYITETNVSSATFSNTLEAPMNIDLKGNTLQNGTPTPSSPIPVNNVSGDNDINVLGKNLLNFNKYIRSSSNITYNSQTDNSVSASGTNAWGSFVYFFENVEKNTDYTLSTKNIEKGCVSHKRIQIIGNSSASTTGSTTITSNDIGTLQLNTPTDADVSFNSGNYNYIGLVFWNNYSGTALTTSSIWEINEVQLEKGTTKSSYEAYNGTTYNIDLPVENKWNYSNVSSINNGSIDNKIITSNAISSGYGGVSANISSLTLQAGTYSISLKVKLESGSASGVNGITRATTPSTTTITQTKTPTLSSSYQLYTAKLVCTETTTITSIGLQLGSTNTNAVLVIKEIQIEDGEKVHPYTPYGTTPIELNKIGTYQDYFYKKNDKWYLHKEIGKVVLNGSESWQTSPYGTNSYRLNYSGMLTANDKVCILSNLFNGVSFNNRTTSGNDIIYRNDQNDYQIQIRNTSYASLSAFTTMLGTSNLIAYYILATPTNTEITYTPLIEQLNTLEEAQSKEGITNVNQVNNDAPFMLDLSVFSGSDTLTINNIGNAPSKPVITLVGSGNVGLYLNDIQVFQISLGTNETIILDTENMEAYYGSQLKNRQVIGDYNSFALQSGENTIRFTGSVSYIEITNYTRWI